MDNHLENCQVRPVAFDSAERTPRKHSPADWLPNIADTMAYDDEIDDVPVGVWFRYYAGGSNELHFVLRDRQDDFFYATGAFGKYEMNGTPYPNIYDAFWVAEQAADRTSPDAVHMEDR